MNKEDIESNKNIKNKFFRNINFGNFSDAKALGYKASPGCDGSRLLSDQPDLPM